MIKKHEALILEIDEIVEEEVFLLIEGTKVRCFVSYCPFQIEVGKQYTVELDLFLPDTDRISLAKEERNAVLEGEGFSCVVCGYLDGPTLRSFVDFTNLDFHYLYPQLNERYVEIFVDRIDVAFV